jgi:hypothetical protein
VRRFILIKQRYPKSLDNRTVTTTLQGFSNVGGLGNDFGQKYIIFTSQFSNMNHLT